jgi:hypothetical protein
MLNVLPCMSYTTMSIPTSTSLPSINKDKIYIFSHDPCLKPVYLDPPSNHSLIVSSHKAWALGTFICGAEWTLLLTILLQSLLPPKVISSFLTIFFFSNSICNKTRPSAASYSHHWSSLSEGHTLFFSSWEHSHLVRNSFWYIVRVRVRGI